MTYYAVRTPGPGFNVRTFAKAKALAHAGLDSIAAKRGYTMDEWVDHKGNYRFSVRNSKGRVVTGCVIVKKDGTPPNGYSGPL